MRTNAEVGQSPSEQHPASGGAPDVPKDDDKKADQKEHQVEEIREHLGGLLTELDRRRHAVEPARLVRSYPFIAVAGALALAGLATGAVVWKVQRSRRRATWPKRLARLKLALKRATDDPDKVAKPEPDLARKVLTAVAVTVAGAVTKRLLVSYLAPHAKGTG